MSLILTAPVAESTTTGDQSLASQQPPKAPKSPTAQGRPRRNVPRPAESTVSAGPPKPLRKVSFYLSPESVRRLGVVASMTDSDKSSVLEQVISSSPMIRRWVVSDRAKASDPGTVEISAD